jgi:hypothetical protein
MVIPASVEFFFSGIGNGGVHPELPPLSSKPLVN